MINVLDYLSRIANGACDIWAELGKERQSRAERRARLREEHAKGGSIEESMCQGCSLRLTGTRGLVGEGGVKGVFEAFRG